MQRRNVVIAAVAVVVVLVIGLTQLGATSGSGGGGRAPSSAEAQRLLAGSPPALDALHADASRLLDGGFKERIAALRGYPVVVNIWGSWCVPCRQEFPVLQRVSAALGKRVAFLGLDTQDPESDARRFLANHPVSYPSYQDIDGSLAKGFGIIGTPSTVYYDAHGKQAYLHQGPYRKDADLRADIERYAGG